MEHIFRNMKKRKKWIVFLVFVVLFAYILGYGIVYRFGDYMPDISWACPIMYYPVNYIRVHSECLYDFTESLYRLCRGKRTIEERSKEIGFHREWHKMDDLGSYYFTYHNGVRTGEYHFYDNGNPLMVLLENEDEYTHEFFYRNGYCALSRKKNSKNGIAKAFWSNKRMFAQWTFGDCSRPIDGFVPKLSNEHQLLLHEYKNGKLVNEYNNLSAFGGTPLLIKEYLMCVSPYGSN